NKPVMRQPPAPVKESSQTVTPRHGESLTAAQTRTLQFVYDYLLRTGEWPPTKIVRVETRHEGRLEDLCEALGSKFITCNYGGGDLARCALRLGALQHVTGGEGDARNILRALAHFVDRYIRAVGEPKASTEEFVTTLEMTEAQ